MIHKFKDSLKNGKAGEDIFFDKFNQKLERLDGRKHDFKIIATGETIELKTDYYNMSDTENFFIERWSDVDKKKPGGPFQSESDLFIYFFVENNRYYVFKTKELVKALEKIIVTLPPKKIFNKGWTTVGYAVPRKLIENLAEEYSL